MLHIISYDLRAPDRDYNELWAALEKIGAKRILQSVWAVKANGKTPAMLRDQLKPHIDMKDRLLVAEVDAWATRAAMIDMNEL